jgi:TolB-like protein
VVDVTSETRLLRFADVEFDVKAGELRRGGMTTRLDITAHLIRAADEGHVWARRFEPSERDMPTLDRTVADAVASAVAAKLLGE